MEESNSFFSSSFHKDIVTKVFFPHESIELINTGYCYDWAYIAYCLWKEVELWSNNIHAWIKVGNKFWDSESLGEQDFNELPCLIRNPWWVEDMVKANHISIEDFKDFWMKNGRLKYDHWDRMVERIQKKSEVILIRK